MQALSTHVRIYTYIQHMHTILPTDRHIVVATTTLYAQHIIYISANIDCSMLQPNTHIYWATVHAVDMCIYVHM